MAPPADSLQGVPLFAGLKKRDIQRLAKTMRERRFKQGETAVVEGKQGLGFFLILEGRAAVVVGDEVVRMLSPGDYFGEIALIDGRARTASIVADTDLRCLGLTSWQFRPFVQEHPDVAWAMLETLVERLRDAQAR